ncbi:hypothetical protein [Hymenobacter cheonanensis]|uniref:hypothetical protein n=1 Tax=Hymenobacter sp. CA2-7 TaxID=3063993 RepID=UPI0027136236|nr:hypothetical protein [Hymenobacter sp. CA2-7]MDO7888266.1 hypothetical protein [Hymenobacter sp. CA2-7]
MTNFSKPPLGFLARATSTAWQDQLRTSVRLYLSLNANPAIEAELEILLRRSEEELLDYLLAGEPPTPDERQRAQEFLDRAQHQLLSSPTDMQQLLAELSAEGSLAPAGLRSRVAASSQEATG